MILNKNPTVILQPLRLRKAYFVLWLFCFLQSIWPSDQSTSRDRKQFEHSTQVLKHSLPRPGQGTFPPRSTKPEILRAPWSQVAMHFITSTPTQTPRSSQVPAGPLCFRTFGPPNVSHPISAHRFFTPARLSLLDPVHTTLILASG